MILDFFPALLALKAKYINSLYTVQEQLCRKVTSLHVCFVMDIYYRLKL